MIEQIWVQYLCESGSTNFMAKVTLMWSVLGKTWSTSAHIRLGQVAMAHSGWAALVLVACSSKDPVRVGVDPSEAVAVQLGGCSWYHTAVLQVGSTSMHVSIDTGSATLAVSAVGCATCEDDGVTELYDPGSGTDQERSASGSYGNGGHTWEGEVFRDMVNLSGISPVEVDFAAVSEQNNQFAARTCDDDRVDNQTMVSGILGLAPDEALVEGTESYLSSIVAAALVPDAFAMQLCHSGGTLWIGGYDESHTTGPMEFSPLVLSDGNSRHYSVEVTSIQVVQDGTNEVIPVSDHNESLPALLDSGGPYLLVPDVAYQATVAAISADRSFAMLGGSDWWEGTRTTRSDVSPEEIDAMLPHLLVDVVGSPPFQLSLSPSESYVGWSHDPGGSYSYWPMLYSDTLMPEEYANFLGLGNLPMASYVVLHDRVNGRIGFAPAMECGG